MTADGGDPFQLTYGEFDATAPRWSPDGRRSPTSRTRTATPRSGSSRSRAARGRAVRRSRRGSTSDPVGTAAPRAGRPGDAAGRFAARVSRHRRGRPELRAGRRLAARRRRVRPRRAAARVRVLPHADGSAERDGAGRDGDGRGRRAVPSTGRCDAAGDARGGRSRHGAPRPRAARRPRPRAGWWSGDLHVHMNYGGAYRNDPGDLLRPGRAPRTSTWWRT